MRQLRAGELDVIIAFNVLDDQDISIQKTRDYDIGLIATPGVLPAGGKVADLLCACADFPLCLPDSSLSLWPRLDGEFTRMRVQPKGLVNTNSVELIRAYIRRGEYMGVLTWLDVVHDVSAGVLCFQALDNLRLRETLCLCTRYGGGVPAAVMAELSQMFEALPQTGQRLNV